MKTSLKDLNIRANDIHDRGTMMSSLAFLAASKPKQLVGRSELRPIQRPIIAELNVFNIGPAMRYIESLIQLQEPDRVISRFQLWAPLFNSSSALECSERYVQLLDLPRRNQNPRRKKHGK